MRTLLWAMLLLALAAPVAAQLGTARVQLVHAAPDPDLAHVDLYADGELLADDLAFGEATPFIELEADRPVDIAVAPSDSDNASEAYVTFGPVIDPSKDHVLAITGVLYPARFPENPQERDTALDLRVLDAPMPPPRGRLAVHALHAVPDAPSVRLTRAAGPLTEALGYGDHAPAFRLAPSRYALGLAPEEEEALAVFWTDLARRSGEPVLLVATGFAAAEGEQPALRLLAVAPDGTTTVLPLLRRP